MYLSCTDCCLALPVSISAVESISVFCKWLFTVMNVYVTWTCLQDVYCIPLSVFEVGISSETRLLITDALLLQIIGYIKICLAYKLMDISLIFIVPFFYETVFLTMGDTSKSSKKKNQWCVLWIYSVIWIQVVFRGIIWSLYYYRRPKDLFSCLQV